ncbi:MAG: FHA domain-containing protein [Anaerolineae bacterium]|nr:FHA domain-containing protein [Anaerolineae bacterium]NUQ03843.1 FHA domain-containing protein [Anaerolineae bacterium]
MSDKSPERPILIVQQEKALDLHWTLPSEEVILGRGEDCDLIVSERQVSRQHVRIFQQGDQYYIEDLESRNGTWVNGDQLKGTRRLNNGDKIQLAMTVKIEYVASGSTAPMPFEVPERLEGGRLKLDIDSRRVFINNVELDPPLSPPQYRLLELLYTNVGRICTREQVVEAVWPEAFGEGVSEQAIDALIRRLRDRLMELDPDWQYIITVRGHGFRLNQG